MAMVEELLQQLIERLDNRYFGKYRGYVSNVTDPLQLGHIANQIPHRPRSSQNRRRQARHHAPARRPVNSVAAPPQ